MLLLDRGGAVSRTVAATTYASPFTGYGPAWSPDGKYLVVPSQGGQPGPAKGLYLIAVEDGSSAVLVSSLTADIYPAWSPDGASIAWSAYRDGNWRIWAMNADGTLQRQLTSQPGQTDFAPRWTTDGRIVYVSLGRDRRRQIRIIDPVSRSDQRLDRSVAIIDQRFYPWTAATSDAIDHEPR